MIPSRRNISCLIYRVGTTLKKSTNIFETRNPFKKIYYNIFQRRNSEPFPVIQDAKSE